MRIINTPSKKHKKVIGILIDFSVFFKEVVSPKQSHFLSSSRLVFNSFYRFSHLIFMAKSTGFLPLLSLISLEAPRIRRALNGLPLLSYSELLTAR